MAARQSFIFYKSFYDAVKFLSIEDRASVLDAILLYQFEGSDMDISGVAKGMFTLIKPQLDANNKKYENGRKGGRPSQSDNLDVTKGKPNRNQTKTKPKANVNENDNVNENVNGGYSPQFLEAWKAYPTTPAMSKSEGWKSWQKATRPEHELLSAVELYAADQSKPKAPYTAHFATWFNQHRYEGYLTEGQQLRTDEAALTEMYVKLNYTEKLICEVLTPPVYKAWIVGAEVDDKEGYVDLLFPTKFKADFFRTHYRDKVEQFIGKSVTCDFKTEAA
jgi:hypothetical protein